MKAIMVILILAISVGLAYADPRMETVGNFCHMILDADNTDNEIFVAGCNSQIVVDDDAKTASGYIKITRWMPREEARAILGDRKRRLSFTSDDSGTPCVMVESNGTEYESNVWESKIMVRRPWRHMNKVVYKLYCLNGERQPPPQDQ